LPFWAVKIQLDVNKFTSRSAEKYGLSKANRPITEPHLNRITNLADTEAMWVHALEELGFLAVIAISYLVALISKRSP
jgi:hypothetical protein